VSIYRMLFVCASTHKILPSQKYKAEFTHSICG
jgi:hypothetical protein